MGTTKIKNFSRDGQPDCRVAASFGNFGIASVAGTAMRPDLNAAERLIKVAEILAAGLMRLRARQSSSISADRGESSLDCAAHRSGHSNVLKGELQ
jgi:hypothetical protein